MQLLHFAVLCFTVLLLRQKPRLKETPHSLLSQFKLSLSRKWSVFSNSTKCLLFRGCPLYHWSVVTTVPLAQLQKTENFCKPTHTLSNLHGHLCAGRSVQVITYQHALCANTGNIWGETTFFPKSVVYLTLSQMDD